MHDRLHLGQGTTRSPTLALIACSLDHGRRGSSCSRSSLPTPPTPHTAFPLFSCASTLDLVEIPIQNVIILESFISTYIDTPWAKNASSYAMASISMLLRDGWAPMEARTPQAISAEVNGATLLSQQA